MHAMRVVVLGALLAGALGGAGVNPVAAEDSLKALPTLLIKGEVVSLDANDPAAMLLKVKDRYGFETPIFVTPETKVTQGEQPLTASHLQAGTAVEVEYSFDINTAKRYAVSVKLPSDSGTASSEAPVAPPAEAAAPDPVQTEAVEPAAPATPAQAAEPSESAPAQ